MEGYLTLVTKGFANYRARKVWVVLDRQQLTWYDRLDQTDQLPKKLKGMMFVRDAVMKKVSEGIFTTCLLLECENVRTMFSCEDSNVCATWYKALTRAIVLHTTIARRDSLPEQYVKILRLQNETLSKTTIARAYKKLCLKEHPDKGGDPEAFNKIKEAYVFLSNRQAYLDEMENTIPIQFEATVRKKEGKVGLGMAVHEDVTNGRLTVGKVMSEIEVVSITEGAEGSIKTGDRLIGIDSDDCSNWTMSRVIARLNLFRVPVKGTVVFTFERRVVEDDLESGEEDSGDNNSFKVSPAESPLPNTFYSTNNPNSPIRDTMSPMPSKGRCDNSKRSDSNIVGGSVENSDRVERSQDVDAIAHEPRNMAESMNKSADISSATPEDLSQTFAQPESRKNIDEASVPQVVQPKVSARERLRLRALEAAVEESNVPVVITVPPLSDESIPQAEPVAPDLLDVGVMPQATMPVPPIRPKFLSQSLEANTYHTLHKAPAKHLSAWTADAEVAKAAEQVRADDGTSAPQTVSSIDNSNCARDADTFQEVLLKQQSYYCEQIVELETAMRRADETVLEKDYTIKSLSSENNTLKGTVSSLAKLLEGRGLGDSEKEILRLHRNIMELEALTNLQENALAQLIVIQNGMDCNHVREMQLYEEQARRVESMLLGAMLKRS